MAQRENVILGFSHQLVTTRFYVWNIERGTFSFFFLGTGFRQCVRMKSYWEYEGKNIVSCWFCAVRIGKTIFIHKTSAKYFFRKNQIFECLWPKLEPRIERTISEEGKIDKLYQIQLWYKIESCFSFSKKKKKTKQKRFKQKNIIQTAWAWSSEPHYVFKILFAIENRIIIRGIAINGSEQCSLQLVHCMAFCFVCTNAFNN